MKLLGTNEAKGSTSKREGLFLTMMRRRCLRKGFCIVPVILTVLLTPNYLTVLLRAMVASLLFDNDDATSIPLCMFEALHHHFFENLKPKKYQGDEACWSLKENVLPYTAVVNRNHLIRLGHGNRGNVHSPSLPLLTATTAGQPSKRSPASAYCTFSFKILCGRLYNSVGRSIFHSW